MQQYHSRGLSELNDCCLGKSYVLIPEFTVMKDQLPLP